MLDYIEAKSVNCKLQQTYRWRSHIEVFRQVFLAHFSILADTMISISRALASEGSRCVVISYVHINSISVFIRREEQTSYYVIE